MLRHMHYMHPTRALLVYRFESRFIDATMSFYQAEGNQLIQEMSIGDYLVLVSNRIQQEVFTIGHAPPTALHSVCCTLHSYET